MYCLDIQYTEPWKNWFFEEVEEVNLQIFITDDPLHLTVPKNHKVKIRIYSRERILNNIAENICYYKEDEHKIEKIFIHQYISTGINGDVVYTLESFTIPR